MRESDTDRVHPTIDPKNWYTAPIPEISQILKIELNQGLSDNEAASRRLQYGSNELQERNERHFSAATAVGAIYKYNGAHSHCCRRCGGGRGYPPPPPPSNWLKHPLWMYTYTKEQTPNDETIAPSALTPQLT